MLSNRNDVPRVKIGVEAMPFMKFKMKKRMKYLVLLVDFELSSSVVQSNWSKSLFFESSHFVDAASSSWIVSGMNKSLLPIFICSRSRLQISSWMALSPGKASLWNAILLGKVLGLVKFVFCVGIIFEFSLIFEEKLSGW